MITAVDGVNVKWKTCDELTDMLDKQLYLHKKKENQILERVISNYNQTAPAVTIKVITLISSEIPKVCNALIIAL